ncbi:MAG: peptidylprolyl isomerase [Alphaproteobacteria bacterium]
MQTSAKSLNINGLRLLLLAGAAATALLLAGCEKDAAATGAPAATVNGKVIHSGKIDEQLAGIPAQLLAGREAEIRAQVLARLVEQELVMQEAKRLKVEDGEEFKKQKKAFEDNLRFNFAMKAKLDAELTDEVLMKAYDSRKDTLAYPAVKASHILVADKAEAENLAKIANPSNFAQLAREKSKDPNASNGGDLGWFRKEAMVPEFAEAAFKATAGSVSAEPVQTQFGWHVVFVEAKEDRHLPSFEEVKEGLRNEMSQQVMQGYVAELKEKAKIVYPDAPKAEATPAAEQPAAPAAQ